MNIAELAAFVSTHLQRHGIDVVLSGGACVAIYSNDAYISLDLDFIEIHFTKRKELRTALAEIGFSEKNRYFCHPETDFFLEFPTGPLAVGSEPVREIHTIVLSTGTLKLISPTDCVKDRMAAYYFWMTGNPCSRPSWWPATMTPLNCRRSRDGPSGRGSMKNS
jgi:hypothetical protein